MKKCYGCGQLKSESEFGKNSGRKDGLQSQCKDCMKAKRQRPEFKNRESKRKKQWMKENPDLILLNTLRRASKRIGLNSEKVIAHYFSKLDEQSGCCEICGKHVSALRRRLDLDHNHITLQLRGLLCENCNKRIGLCWENIVILKKTIRYLEKYKS